jgi:2-polyprenyl-3-methyl-5-hydroxy-6-metoxy-1,4-benzoquinol methylase
LSAGSRPTSIRPGPQAGSAGQLNGCSGPGSTSKSRNMPDMDFTYWQQNWDRLGQEDPLWAILTHPTKKGGRWTPAEFFETGQQEITDVLARLSRLNIAFNRDTALDFGCGVGRLSQALALHFGEVNGVDVSQAMIDSANRFNQQPKKCHYFLNTKPDLSLFASDSYDFVYSNIVLQHILPRHALTYIREFIRVLKPGGLAVFQVLTPTLLRRVFPQSVVDRYRMWKYKGAPMIGMFGIPRGTLAKVIGSCGGRILDLEAKQSSDLGWRWVSLNYVVRK